MNQPIPLQRHFMVSNRGLSPIAFLGGVQGGAGDDTLYADSPISVDTAIAQGGNAGNSHNVQGDWLSGGAGNDTLVGSNANDVLTGGLGSDLIIAGAGDDSIFGDIDWTTSTLDWTVTDSNGVRTFSPVDASLTPTDTTGSADVIYAGAGADWVMAGGGNDVVFGEEGNDTLAGNGGNDILMGGVGSDHLYGDGAERMRWCVRLAANDERFKATYGRVA